MNENKILLRCLLKQRLSTLSQERKRASALQLFSSLFPLLPKNILSFCSTSLEIDLGQMNSSLAVQSRLFLPKIEGEHLSIYKVNDIEHETVLHPWGFREPKAELCEKVSLSEIDLILVPGLGFDQEKHRLGQGGGFYDRLLKRGSQPCWGLGFKEQLLPEIPFLEHDCAMSEIHIF